MYFYFFKEKAAYEWRISDCSQDVCSSDLGGPIARRREIPFAIGILFHPLEEGLEAGRPPQFVGAPRLGHLGNDEPLGGRADPEPDIGRQIGSASGRERVCQYWYI